MAEYKQDESGQWWYYYGTKKPCRTRATVIQCEWCGNDCFRHSLQQKPARFCGKKCASTWQHYETDHPFARKGTDSLNWQGGVRIHKGYRDIYNPEHPSNKGKAKHGSNMYVREHRLVMEEALGRYLRKGEMVHHINGDKLDNGIENLELWVNGHPYGQRAGDFKHCPTCTCHQPEIILPDVKAA